MQIRGVMSRRSPVILCAVLCAGLVAVSSAVAAGALPVGSDFRKELGSGGAIAVRVVDGGVSVNLSKVPVRCAKKGANGGGEARVSLGLSSSSRQPAVGTTYTLTKTRTDGHGAKGTSTVTEVTLKFKSAQQVLVGVDQVSKDGGKVVCDGSATYKVGRRS